MATLRWAYLFAKRHSTIPSGSYRGSAGRQRPVVAGLVRGCGFESKLFGAPLRKNRRDAATGAFSLFRVSEWSVRRKVVAVLTLPVILAAVFGGLRVRTELVSASDYSVNQQQASVLAPAIASLDATERLALPSTLADSMGDGSNPTDAYTRALAGLK